MINKKCVERKQKTEEEEENNQEPNKLISVSKNNS